MNSCVNISSSPRSHTPPYLCDALMLLCLLCWCWLPRASLALESDAQEPISITADHAELSETTGLATYSGDVELTQGSLKIRCDRLIITSKTGGFENAKAIGKPAYFEQKVNIQDPKIEAQANTIVYLPNDNKVVLKTNAQVKQGSNQFEGNQIEYSLDTQSLSASKQTATESPTLESRVRMILQPSPTLNETRPREE